MNADEIRNLDVAGFGGAIGGLNGQADSTLRAAIFLREIAAQLAELNKKMADIAESLTYVANAGR